MPSSGKDPASGGKGTGASTPSNPPLARYVARLVDLFLLDRGEEEEEEEGELHPASDPPATPAALAAQLLAHPRLAKVLHLFASSPVHPVLYVLKGKRLEGVIER